MSKRQVTPAGGKKTVGQKPSDVKVTKKKEDDSIPDGSVLEGFDLETRLRKSIYDILHPVGNKV
jgi:hypothetical protein